MGTAELRYYKLMERGQRDYLTLGVVEVRKNDSTFKLFDEFIEAHANDARCT